MVVSNFGLGLMQIVQELSAQCPSQNVEKEFEGPL